MSLSSLTNESSFGSSSIRRRRMLALYALSQLNAVDVDSRRARCDLPQENAAVESAPPELIDPFERIRDLLDDPASRTWVFAGDDYGFSAENSARSWSELFKDFVKQRLGRKLDAVIDSSVRGSRISRLLDDVEWRILRYQPDVVILSPGEADFSEAPDLRTAMRDALTKLIGILEEDGCAVIVCTPPAVEEPLMASHPGIAETARLIRTVAGETGALLVDHHDRWLRTFKQPGFKLKLFQPDGLHPSRDGHLKLARQLLRSLGIIGHDAAT